MTWLDTLWELVETPFRHEALVWGIVPLYFAWLLNELTSDKASYRTALQTGFSFLWAGAQWVWLLLHRSKLSFAFTPNSLIAVNVAVTLLALAIGAVALLSGLTKRYPPYCSFLGHSRFSSYFMILLYPMQSGHLKWSWARVETIAVSAVPVWLICWLVFKPLRK